MLPDRFIDRGEKADHSVLSAPIIQEVCQRAGEHDKKDADNGISSQSLHKNPSAVSICNFAADMCGADSGHILPECPRGRLEVPAF